MHPTLRLLALAAAVTACAATAAPHAPANDDTVLATVPAGAALVRQRQLQQRPRDLPLATSVAQAALARARREGDPRELGAAQAALAPWWTLADPPAEVRLLRALLRQSRHEFEPALADLAALLADPRAPLPSRAQAELSAAGILQVLGRFDEARRHCQRLAGPAYATVASAGLPARVCLAELDSLNGRTAAAAGELARLASIEAAAAPGWIALVRAELAERRADPRARALYVEAQRGGELYARAAYADWLLANGGAPSVPALLAGHENADALLLRLAIAQKALALPGATDSRATLRARFDAARLRGERLHLREEARAVLDLDGDPARALTLAQQQWSLQKEPADALLLVRAARAAGRAEAAEPVWQFMRETGYRDARLQAPASLQPRETTQARR